MEDYDLDELIKLAKTKPTTIEQKLAEANQRELTDAHRFAIAKNLKVGTAKISFRQIYSLYRQWVGDDAVSSGAFGKQLTKLFKRHRDAASSYYLLDPEPFIGVTSSVEEVPKESKAPQK